METQDKRGKNLRSNEEMVLLGLGILFLKKIDLLLLAILSIV